LNGEANSVSKKQNSATIVADVRRFYHQINPDGVFGTHTSRKRVGIAADTPTVAEAGYPYLGLDSVIGMYGPRGMSNALRESVAADVRAVVEADPTVANRLAATGQVVDIRGPAEFAAGIKEIRDQLASIAQALGIKAAQ
jgi:tripartite-type tricarboxylate transporter receptor subunit TctC